MGSPQSHVHHYVPRWYQRRFLKTGQFLDPGKITSNKLQNTLITAAIRDKSTTAVDFGMGTGNGMIAGIMA